MITFITEAKSNTPNPHNNNGMQDSRESRMRSNKATKETIASRISHSSQLSARGAAGVPHVTPSSNTLGLERRMCLERLSFSLEVSLIDNGEQVGSGMIRNVGGRGIFVETSSKLVYGTPVQFDFTLMGGNARFPSHRVVGRVAHVTDEGIGVHLDVLKRDTLAGLQALKKQAGRELRSKLPS